MILTTTGITSRAATANLSGASELTPGFDVVRMAIIKSMQFTSQIERLLYNIIGFEPTKWTIYLPLPLLIAILFKNKV
jgi:hypothetical protein